MIYILIKGLQRLCEKPILILVFLIYPSLNFSQVYNVDNEEDISRVILDNEYIVISKFKSDSGNFISTLGGYYQLNEGVYEINLEFNSNYEQDSIESLSIAKTSKWKNISKENNTLNGKWVMSGRYNNGEFRTRNTALPRKTMKVLIDGFFQWIAFNTETFKFSGSGGGEYETVDGKYIEIIQYFSRDDSRVGAELDFNYEIKNKDWYHTGLSSKGKPINEVWSIRDNK
ncbi:MAG: hypothetical protein CMC42_00025 [Flavobacteriaceae bacterium]|nr:hypothetical protein [Flavobacteriaceae bacterium]|tara:strand:+ start:1491 stop:2177 length:687 start_codon:yes stop_codon:yes gene_type:complete